MRNFGQRASELGERTGEGEKREVSGSAPMEDRYPSKYKGLVEAYFKALAEGSEM